MSTSPRTCAHTCQPLHPPQKGHQRGPCAASRLPPCAQNFLPNLTQSLANSRLTLVYLYVPLTFQRIGQRGDSNRLPAARIPLRFARCPCTQTAICAAAVNHPHHINHVNHSSDKCQPALVPALIPVNPSIRRKKASSAARTRPARPPARPSPASRLPCCPQNFSHNLTHSLVISRHLSCISPVLTQYAIRNSAPNLLRPPCRSLDHRINCTHSRKTKATANHLCTLTNVYCLTEQPQLQDHNAPAPDATLCAHPQTFFSERARQHMNSRGSSRHFAPMPPTHLRHTGTPPPLMRHCAPPTATRFAATRSTHSSRGTASRPGRRSRQPARSILRLPSRNSTQNCASTSRPV